MGEHGDGLYEGVGRWWERKGEMSADFALLTLACCVDALRLYIFKLVSKIVSTGIAVHFRALCPLARDRCLLIFTSHQC
jgi:hypothetical protein